MFVTSYANNASSEAWPNVWTFLQVKEAGNDADPKEQHYAYRQESGCCGDECQVAADASCLAEVEQRLDHQVVDLVDTFPEEPYQVVAVVEDTCLEDNHHWASFQEEPSAAASSSCPVVVASCLEELAFLAAGPYLEEDPFLEVPSYLEVDDGGSDHLPTTLEGEEEEAGAEEAPTWSKVIFEFCSLSVVLSARTSARHMGCDASVQPLG